MTFSYRFGGRFWQSLVAFFLNQDRNLSAFVVDWFSLAHSSGFCQGYFDSAIGAKIGVDSASRDGFSGWKPGKLYLDGGFEGP